MLKGRVVYSAKRVFEVKLESGQIVSAMALAMLIKGRDDHIVVGDYVGLIEEQNAYKIVEISKRSNEIFRLNSREATKKIIAANADLALILVSVSLPEYKRGLVDRYLVRSIEWGIPTLLVFNKSDELDRSEIDLSFESDRLRELGVKSFEISAKYPEKMPTSSLPGFNDLKIELSGKTAIMLGQSGVGKSKLISALTDGNVQLRIHELSKANKGSHTTTWAELVEYGDYALIDSPGVRSFSVQDIIEENLPKYFPDIALDLTRCKFTNCRHDERSKGCYFKTLDPNSREVQIKLSRLDSYLRLEEEIRELPNWEKE